MSSQAHRITLREEKLYVDVSNQQASLTKFGSETLKTFMNTASSTRKVWDHESRK